jgi:hypothetical protein
MVTYSAAGGHHGATQWSVQWKNRKGVMEHQRSTNARRMVEVILTLRWYHGNDFPIIIARRRVGDHQWNLSDWDDLVDSLHEPDREECRIRQGWIEPIDR